MAFGKSLELRKIKSNKYFLGDYTLVSNQYFRSFSSGSTVYSKDGKSSYLVGRDGSFRSLT